jgi:hypothetical protein
MITNDYWKWNYHRVSSPVIPCHHFKSLKLESGNFLSQQRWGPFFPFSSSSTRYSPLKTATTRPQQGTTTTTSPSQITNRTTPWTTRGSRPFTWTYVGLRYLITMVAILIALFVSILWVLLLLVLERTIPCTFTVDEIYDIYVRDRGQWCAWGLSFDLCNEHQYCFCL